MDKIKIFRVRKSFSDLHSQRGAYFLIENAIVRAEKTKCNVYDETGKCVWEYGQKGDIK